MDAFFSEIDVLLFPSQWKESFGLSVREALARDVWVIATDAGGVVEDCIDGTNATIIPMVPDHRPLKAAIEGVFDTLSPATYQNPAKAGIVGLDQQAAELSRYLGGLIRDRGSRSDAY
jgi:glycosyltransferase involved in cell wall biosynthesis